MSGNGKVDLLNFNRAPERVVSLVPSMTDSLIELGLGHSLVGITRFCPVPAKAPPPEVVGGTRQIDVARVVELRPDLVLANQEENEREQVEALEQAGLPLWMTFPHSVGEAIQVLHALAGVFRRQDAVNRIRTLEVALDWTRRAQPDHRLRLFCPIWMQDSDEAGRWWMTFNRETYAHDVLSVCSAENVFADRERRYPLLADLGQDQAEAAGDRDTRYPRVTTEEVEAAKPEVILLPSEPFPFSDKHIDGIEALFAETPAVKHRRVHMVDGRLITWHGTRLARALTELPPLLQPGDPA